MNSAADLLLTQSSDYSYRFRKTWMRMWAENRVACIGDHGNLQDVYIDYTIVTANVIVMLFQIDGPEEMIETAKNDNGLFVQICHLIFTRNWEFSKYFDEAFGDKWHKRYKDIKETEFWYETYDLVEWELGFA